MIASHFVIRNIKTNQYYKSTQPYTELHFFGLRYHACSFIKKEYAVQQATKIRGRRWQRWLVIMKMRVGNMNGDMMTGKLHGRWSTRIEAEEIA